MSDQEHKNELTSKLKEYLEKIDSLDIHPRNKILIYQKYVLGKISWHLTVTKIPSTWIKEKLDNMVSSYMRSWLELPVSATLKIATLSRSKYGLNFINISTRFTQCQLTFRKALKNSANKNINKLHQVTRKGTNIRADSYLSTRDAIKRIRSNTEDEIKGELTTQSLVIKSIWEQSCAKYNSSWCKVLDSLPRNLYSFVVRYLSNSLANGTNAVRWGIANSSKCLYCDENQTLQHVVSTCKSSLNDGRWTWRHNSILINIARMISKIQGVKVYCDINDSEFQNPSIITGDNERPDLVVVKDKKCYVLELTVGFETNIRKNSERKQKKYANLITRLQKDFEIQYVDLSMGCIGVIGEESKRIKTMFDNLGLEKEESAYLVKKMINVCLRSTYYIFCQRNKEWESPDLLTW